MKISLLHPSRSRPQQALETMVHWLQNIEYPQTWEYILSVDSNDPKIDEYHALGMKGLQNVCMIVNDNQNLVQAANKAAAKVSISDILILISDDFKCFKGWNKSIVSALEGKSGVLKTFDGVQRYIVTLPILTKDYYDQQGYIYYPKYTHMFCDLDQTHKSDLQKKLIIRNDIVFSHNHYSKGGHPKDAVNIKADKTWNQGERVYLQRCRERFGLGNVNVYNLSPEARRAGHINWMKKKGVR